MRAMLFPAFTIADLCSLTHIPPSPSCDITCQVRRSLPERLDSVRQWAVSSESAVTNLQRPSLNR